MLYDATIASAKLAELAFKSPIRLLYAVIFIPPEKSIPFTAGDVVDIIPFSSIIIDFVFIYINSVPALTEIPFVYG